MADQPPAITVGRWRVTKEAAQPARKPLPRQQKRYLLLGILLAAVGSFLGMLSWFRPLPRPLLVPLWITEYQSRDFPVNTLAEQDREALRQGGYFPNVSENAFSRQERHLLVQELAALKDRSASEPIVLYLCAFAETGDLGLVYVLPGDVRADEPRTALPLRQVLTYLKDCPSRHKLLVLDIMRPLLGARLGVLVADVSAQILEDLRAVEDRNRLVLTSCSPGQISYNSEVLQRSIFGYYFEQALRGGAEGYNPQGYRDGRVSVFELGRFVQARVERWVQHNRNAHQTPRLLGFGKDFKLDERVNFQLVALRHGEVETPVPAPAMSPYPDWLRDAWKVRDQWWNDESYRVAPRYFLQLQADLMRAEQRWRGGVDIGRLQNDLKERMGRAQSRLAQARAHIQPEPRSLALARAQGRQPDDALTAALHALLTKWHTMSETLKPEEAAKAPAQLIAEFYAKWKNPPPFALAWAVWDQACDDTYLGPDKFRFLNQLLQTQQSQALYVETRFLQRLSQLADQLAPNQWPVEIVGQALTVVQRGELAASRAWALTWVRDMLNVASQYRYNGEISLWARGYVPLNVAQTNLESAAAIFDIILSQEDGLQQAQRTLDQALALLPTDVAYVLWVPSQEKSWIEASQAALALDETLHAPAVATVPSPEVQLPRDEDLRQKTARLRNALEDLRQPFTADRVAQLVDQLKQPDANVSLLLRAYGLFRVPFLKAEERVALYQAAWELESRLNAETIQQDEDEDARHQQTPVPLDSEQEQLRQLRLHREAGALRAQLDLAVLQLGGLTKDVLQPLEEGLQRASAPQAEPSAWYPLAQAFHTAWSVQLPAQLKEQTDLRARERLSFIYPPFDPTPLLDVPATNPTVQRLTLQDHQLWSWLADVYRYRGRDYIGSAFFADVASDYQQFTPTLPETYIVFNGPSSITQLTTANPVANVVQQLLLYLPPQSPAPKIQVNIVMADNDWLQVVVDRSDLNKLTAGPADAKTAFRSCLLPLRVILKPGATLSGTPRPNGFMIEVQINERTFHFPIALPSLPLADSERLEIILSADRQNPTTSLFDLRLRPTNTRQPYFVYVRNGTVKPREVVAEVLIGDAVPKGGTLKLSLAPKETKPVSFGDITLKPDMELPEFPGRLELRLVDAANPTTILDAKPLRVDIATPREYVRISDIVWKPASAQGKNQFAVRIRAVAALGPPPCPVELILPPSRIPGLLAVKDGNFKGMLPAVGEELKLYADNIQLAEGVDDEGAVYLNVDGLARAFLFRATFARFGDPTTPREDLRPAIHLHADRYVLSTTNFPVTLETDNGPPGATVQINLGRIIDGQMDPDLTKNLSTARRRHVGFSPQGTDGAMLFEASLRDWTVPLDVSQILGQRMLEARLLDQAGNELSRALQPVTIDNSAPDQVQLLNLPKQAKFNLPLTVRALGIDNESGIKQVNFFFGKPIDGKLAPMTATIPGVPDANDPQTWTAQLTPPMDKKGPSDISVQFINNVGLSSFATASVEFVDALPVGPTSIKGKLMEGDRPQVGLEVQLKDPKDPKGMTILAKTKTAPDGSFVFENVKPGDYKVTAAKVETRRKAEKNVAVAAGQTVDVTLQLSVKQ